jgi:transposase
MNQKRKLYSPEIKAKIALLAIREESTIPEIAAKYQVHPSAIKRWKRTALDSLCSIFNKDGQGYPNDLVSQSEMDTLYKKIGQLEVERDFLSKALKH